MPPKSRKPYRAYARQPGKNGQRLWELTVKLYSPLPTCTCDDDGRICDTCRAYGELGQALESSLAALSGGTQEGVSRSRPARTPKA